MWAPSPWDEGAPGGEELNKGEEAWMDYFLDAELSPQDSPPSGRAARRQFSSAELSSRKPPRSSL